MTPFIVISIVALVAILYYLAFQVYLLKLENKSQEEINRGLIDRFEHLKNNFITLTESSTELANKVSKNTDAQEEWNMQFVNVERAFKNFIKEEFKKNEKDPIKKGDTVYLEGEEFVVDNVIYTVNSDYNMNVFVSLGKEYFTTKISALVDKKHVSKTKPKKAKK